MTISLPTTPIYVNILSQPVFWLDGAAQTPRDEREVLCLVMHHTAGKDSREWLAGAPGAQGATCTYLVGAYADTENKPRIYKYMSERTVIPQTQGYGFLGGLPYRINRHCISIEVEGLGGDVPFRQDVLDCAATLAASIIKDWHDTRHRNLLLIGHDHLDAWSREGRHTDPHWDHTRFNQMVYARIGGLNGDVKGWGR